MQNALNDSFSCFPHIKLNSLLTIDISHLKGSVVYLEELLPEHIDTLRKLANDERIWEFTKTILINDQYDDQFTEYIKVTVDPSLQHSLRAFIIRQVKDHAIIGTTRFYDIDEKNKRLNIGYTWYIPSVWGKAHNKECKLLLLQYAFEILKFNRVGFEVAHQNIRSQKAVEKIGGVREGELRN